MQDETETPAADYGKIKFINGSESLSNEEQDFGQMPTATATVSHVNLAEIETLKAQISAVKKDMGT